MLIFRWRSHRLDASPPSRSVRCNRRLRTSTSKRALLIGLSMNSFVTRRRSCAYIRAARRGCVPHKYQAAQRVDGDIVEAADDSEAAHAAAPEDRGAIEALPERTRARFCAPG